MIAKLPNRAFTLIEVLVVILIIAILIALIIPAVQAAREASRRTFCSNNLRQLGIGLNGYLSANGCLPPGNHARGFSFHTAMLPFIEQIALYQSINFSTKPSDLNINDANFSASQTSLSVFQCPSDSSASHIPASTNYAGNRGVGFRKSTTYGVDENGAFNLAGPPIRAQDVSDGLSQTAAISEWLLRATTGNMRDKRRTILFLPSEYTEPSQFEQFATACQALDTNRAMINGAGKGLRWIHGDVGDTLYNHVLPINNNSCLNGNGRFYQQSAWTAGSGHWSGANTLFLDGHVAFVTDTIERSNWRAMGSRNGGDVVSEFKR